MSFDVPAGVAVVTGADTVVPESAERVLTRPALKFVATLERQFGERRRELLARRQARQRELDAGAIPGFLVETRAIREADWRVAPTPAALERRRVEITGPVDRKMMINALNSGADAFMADFEDSLSPTWANVLDGQLNVQDAVRGTLDFTGPDGRRYALRDERATLILRPRGWHLAEAHVLVDDVPVSASLFDFGMAFFHNAGEQLAAGAGPYYYLPKLESRLEARLWNDVFAAAERSLGLPDGSVRATVLIETVLAAFEMEEILYELRDRAAGLNAGRWDYIFSVVKKFSGRADMVLPDRAQVTMAVPFMRAYTEQLVRVCHRRGAHAIGGMAAFVPNRRDPAVTEAAVARVREDKEREAGIGFDGTWVAHPDLVPVAMDVFRARLGDRPHQKDVQVEGRANASALLRLDVPDGRVTDAGVRTNVDVALRYLDAWLRGAGAVAIHNLMEDAATAEISRAQLWQWIRHGVPTEDGDPLTPLRYAFVRDETLLALERDRGDAPSRLRDAADLLDRLVLGTEFVEFLTLPGYPMLDPSVATEAAAPESVPVREDAAPAPREPVAPVAPPVWTPAAEPAVDAPLPTTDWRASAIADLPRRDYSAEDVVRLRGSLAIQHTLAAAGAARLRELLAARARLHPPRVRTGAEAVSAAQAGAELLHVAGGADPVRRVNEALLREHRASGTTGSAALVPVLGEIDPSLVGTVELFDEVERLISAGAAGVVLRPAAGSDARAALSAARLASDVAAVPIVLVIVGEDARAGAADWASYADVVVHDGAAADPRAPAPPLTLEPAEPSDATSAYAALVAGVLASPRRGGADSR